MQEIFANDPGVARSLINSISKERFQRYVNIADGDILLALRLYHWNMRLSQALHFPVQVWEITLRNKLNTFLERRYGPTWLFDADVALRQLTALDRRRLDEAKSRQIKRRRTRFPPNGAIVADLSAGFWVSLLSRSYEIPFGWGSMIGRVFPHDATLDRRAAHALCVRMLDLRNRIAHHEPVHHLALLELKADAERLIGALCPAAHLYVAAKQRLDDVIAAAPPARRPADPSTDPKPSRP